MTTYPTITRIELSEHIDRDRAADALSEVFPNATVHTGMATERHIPYAAYAGRWYQADRKSPVYSAIAEALDAER